MKLWFEAVTPAFAWALNEASCNTSFAEICAGLAQWMAPDEIPHRAAVMLKRWTEMGLVSALNLRLD